MRAVWAGPDAVNIARQILGIVRDKDGNADRWLHARVHVQGHDFESLGLKGASYGFSSTEQLQYTQFTDTWKEEGSQLNAHRRKVTKPGVFQELTFPSRDKLKAALKKRTIEFTEAQLDAVVKKSGARQLYAPRSTYPGKIATYAPDTRWVADIISLVSKPNPSGHA